MKSWLKSSSLPAIFLSALALATLGVCFLLATHHHTGILKTLVQARQYLTQASARVSAHQNAAAPHRSQHKVTLSWKASTTAGVSYNVYRRGPSGTVKLNATPLPATTYVDDTVQSGQVYHYFVKAVNAKGTESNPSNEVPAPVPSP